MTGLDWQWYSNCGYGFQKGVWKKMMSSACGTRIGRLHDVAFGGFHYRDGSIAGSLLVFGDICRSIVMEALIWWCNNCI